uniref:Uncharacterized protein n=1 Tax=Arcella intermedia TaxID=1963864 RepID=A0A6B2L9G3_9EUKA
MIEEQIKYDKRTADTKLKLLLLGTGDSGKSTFMKQMKVIHLDGFSSNDKEKFRVVLKEGCLSAMKSLLENENVHVPKHLKDQRDVVLEATTIEECGKDITLLWHDPSLKDAFIRRTEIGISNIPSNADYYFEHAQRFAEAHFEPTMDDIFRLKLKTTGVSDIKFSINNIQFSLVDVGGQRAERRKWLHCFDDVTSVIYLAALDEYDMRLEEDNLTNRMEESLRLFEEVTGNKFFHPTSWILFLNKSDLFEEKIKRLPLNGFFQDISEEEAADFDSSCKYIQNKYLSRFKGQRLYPYITCAIDTGNCKRVFNALRDTVITSALHTAGFY